MYTNVKKIALQPQQMHLFSYIDADLEIEIRTERGNTDRPGRYRWNGMLSDRNTDRKIDRETGRKTDGQENKEKKRRTDRQKDRWRVRQKKERLTDRRSYSYKRSDRHTKVPVRTCEAILTN